MMTSAKCFFLVLVLCVTVCGGTTVTAAERCAVGCVHENFCPEGQWLDPRLGQAAVAPDNCVPRCSAYYNGEKWSHDAQSCVPICKSGYDWVPDTKSCKAKCSGGQIWSEETVSCECPEGQNWYAQYQACMPRGEFLRRSDDDRVERNKIRVESAKANACPEGQERTFSGKQCVSICKGLDGNPNGTWDKASGMCNCPEGTSWHAATITGTSGCK